jgi:hypothetical protein
VLTCAHVTSSTSIILSELFSHRMCFADWHTPPPCLLALLGNSNYVLTLPPAVDSTMHIANMVAIHVLGRPVLNRPPRGGHTAERLRLAHLNPNTLPC